jgi:outer membrane protein assembly factor BamB
MRDVTRLSGVMMMAAALSAGACDKEPASDPAPTTKELLGAWSGTMTHAGEEETLALELEPAEEGKVSVRLTVPAMKLARVPAGTVELRIEGSQVTLGVFVFNWDAEAETLTGTMPAGMVPVYEVPVTLRRVEAIEAPTPLEPTAPLVEPVWTFDAGAPLWAGATLADDVVYAGDDEGRLHALDVRTGAERWSFAAGGPIRTRATLAGGAVYFQADDGILYRLDAASGKEVWQSRVVETSIHRLPPTDPQSRFDNFGSDVAVADGRLFLGTHDGRLVAVDPADGQQLWEFEADGSVLAAPAVSSGRVFFGSFEGDVHALDAATGEPLWKTDTRGAVLSTPAVAGDVLVVGNRTYDLLGLEAQTGEVAWKSYIWFSWVESSATVESGVAYIGSSDAAAVFAFDASTGRRIWKTDVHGWAWGQPAVTADRVFVQTAGLRGYSGDARRGGVMALERETGQAVWRYAAEPPEEGAWGFPGSPAVGAGHVFVTGIDGRVLSFAQ